MRADAVRNRHRILESAATALAESGPDVALEEIAARAGVGIGTLYRHFPDRFGLLVEVYRSELEALTSLGAELESSDDPGAALRQFLRANLEFSRRHRSLAADVIAAGIALQGDSAAVVSPCALICDRATELIERAQRAGAIRSDVDVEHVMRLVGGIAMATEDAATDPELSTRLLGLVLDGLQVGSATPPER
jgi:AcrR family transcriptional regulator